MFENNKLRWIGATLALGWLAPAMAQAQIVDRDGDGLIEINNLDDLNEIRNDLRGASLRGSSEGCPSGACYGYELTRDLDFDTNGNGTLDDGDWNYARPWWPIQGTKPNVPLDENRFHGTFQGNGHTIRNLRVRRITNVPDYGLFGSVSGARILNLKLTRADVNIFGDSNHHAGALAGRALGGTVIHAVSVEGLVYSQSQHQVGGILGSMLESKLQASHFSGQVVQTGNDTVSSMTGGVVGQAQSSLIHGCSARGRVSGANAAGLVAYIGTTGILGSFANVEVHGRRSAAGLVDTAHFNTAGVDPDIASNPDYYLLTDNYALGSVRTDTGGGSGLITGLYAHADMRTVLRNSYAKNVITGANGYQWANLVQITDSTNLEVRDSYWAKDPAGAILPENSIQRPSGMSGQMLADLKCASKKNDGCAQPLLFEYWQPYWDYGTKTELPALGHIVTHRWVSVDSPNASGDHEPMSKLRNDAPNDTCDNPTRLAAKVKKSGYVFVASSDDQVLETFNAQQGLYCVNSQQSDGACMNYRTRFRCDATANGGTVYWSTWNNYDAPSSNGVEDERFAATVACSADKKIGIEATDLSGHNLRGGPPQKLDRFSTKKGLVCLNADGKCKDYEVSMTCVVYTDRQ